MIYMRLARAALLAAVAAAAPAAVGAVAPQAVPAAGTGAPLPESAQRTAPLGGAAAGQAGAALDKAAAEAILAGAPQGPQGAARSEAAPLLEPGRPRRVAASVFPLPVRPGLKPYLRMEADYEILVASPLEAVRAAILSYEDYPRYFTRLEKVEVVEAAPPGAAAPQGPAARAAGAPLSAAPAAPAPTAPGTARLKMRSAIRVLGLVFPSESTCDYAEVLEAGGGAALVGFRSVGDDGSATDISGGWRLEARGKGRTYVRYRLSSSVRADFPMQKEIMERFMDADLFAVLSGLEAEAARRAAGGAPGAAPGSPGSAGGAAGGGSPGAARPNG